MKKSFVDELFGLRPDNASVTAIRTAIDAIQRKRGEYREAANKVKTDRERGLMTLDFAEIKSMDNSIEELEHAGNQAEQLLVQLGVQFRQAEKAARRTEIVARREKLQEKIEATKSNFESLYPMLVKQLTELLSSVNECRLEAERFNLTIPGEFKNGDDAISLVQKHICSPCILNRTVLVSAENGIDVIGHAKLDYMQEGYWIPKYFDTVSRMQLPPPTHEEPPRRNRDVGPSFIRDEVEPLHPHSNY